MFEILDQSTEACIGFKVSGKVSAADYDILLPKLDKAIEAQGTGLGLAIAQEVLSKHGGAIECESQAGAGATFRFHVPIVDAGFANRQ